MRTDLLGTDVSLELDERWTAYWLAFVRILAGWWFFHAGFEKLLYGFDAQGYMLFASKGTITAPVMQAFGEGAGLAFTNVMIPMGEFLIGLGLMVGALTRLAAFFGGFMLFFLYFTNADWAHGMVSSDLLGMLLFITLAVLGAGRVLGVDAWLERTNWAQSNDWSRYVLG